MAQYTTQGFINELKRRKERLIQETGQAIGAVHAMQVVRIFDEGKAKSGNIGTYNKTKPLYVSPKTAPKTFAPKGKRGTTSFKNGKSHKTGYFSSYSAFRAAMGRESVNVNLRLTGQLQSDYNNSLQQSGLTWTTGTKNAKNAKKVEGIVRRYGADVFKLTQEEHAELVRQTTAIRIKLKV